MTILYPIVLETEDSGAVSAYVPGLPVYAAAESHAKAERAIRGVFTAYLNARPASRPDGETHGSAWHVAPTAGCGMLISSASRPLWALVRALGRLAPREPMAGLV